MMDRKIILFELNEVPWRIIDQFCRWAPTSHLARRLRECRQFETYSEDVGHLSPWITWPSLHRGVPDEKHFIGSFGQDLTGQDKDFPPVWQLLAKAGVPTGVCGSLHTYPLPTDLQGYAFYLPDTFAAGSECFPNKLSIYQDFNLRMARDSSRNISLKVPWASTLKFLRSAGELGLRFRTFLDVGKQLVSERMKSWRKVRRRTYQTVLAFDVFMKQLETTKPGFTTFFTNHVASSMHRYWAAAFPSDYETFGFDDQWVKTFGDEIRFTMGKFDEFFGRLLAFADRNPDYTVWIATSMGQAATEARPLETQLYVTDVSRFMETMGLGEADWKVRPAMLPQCNFAVVPEKLALLRERLSRLVIDGRPLRYREREAGFFSLDFGHNNLHDKPQFAFLDGHSIEFARLGLKNVEIEDKSNSSAYHIPNGSLLIYDPRDRTPLKQRTQISTLEVVPTILKNFQVETPRYMKAPAPLMTSV